MMLGACFAAGTPILTSEGEKPIEQIQVGDYVLARAEQDATGRVEPKRVEEIYRTEGELLVHPRRTSADTSDQAASHLRERSWLDARR